MPQLPRLLQLVEYLLMAVGGILAVVWGVQWWRRGPRDPLRGSPIRSSRLTPVLLWLCFIVHLLGWTIGAQVAALAAPTGLEYGELESWRALFSTNLAQILAGVTCLVVAKAVFQAGWRGFGLTRQTIRSDLAYALAGWLVATCLCSLTYDATTVLIRLVRPEVMLPEHTVLEILSQPSTALSMRILAIGGAFILAPVSEELFFRGIVQTGIKKLIPHRWGSLRHRWIAITVTSLFFAVMHMTTWHHVPALLVLAVILGYLYERRGSLVAPILLHMLFNGRTLLWQQLQLWWLSTVRAAG